MKIWILISTYRLQPGGSIHMGNTLYALGGLPAHAVDNRHKGLRPIHIKIAAHRLFQDRRGEGSPGLPVLYLRVGPVTAFDGGSGQN